MIIANYILVHMVELITFNQVNYPRITFDWNGIWKFWIQFWNPLIEIHIRIEWNNKILTKLNLILEKSSNLVAFVWGNIWFKILSHRHHIKILITYLETLCKTETFVLIRIWFSFLFSVLSVISKPRNISEEFWNLIFEQTMILLKNPIKTKCVDW